MQKFPNKVKFNKSHKIKQYKGLKARVSSFFKASIVTKNRCIITWNNFESFRKVYVRSFRSREIKNKKNFKLIQSRKKKKKKKQLGLKKKNNSLIFKSHFYSPITKKPLQVRMGKGKGSVDRWVFPCSFNRVLIEQLTTIRKKKIKRVFYKSLKKMPFFYKLVFDKRKQLFPNRLNNFFFKNRQYLNYNVFDIKTDNYKNYLIINSKNER